MIGKNEYEINAINGSFRRIQNAPAHWGSAVCTRPRADRRRAVIGIAEQERLNVKAITYDRYGPPDVLRLEEVPTPTPGNREVLIDVQAASVNAADRVLMRADPFWIRLMGMGMRRPKHRILGFDVAGRIAAVGRDVEQLAPGDEVFGACSFGGFAEQVCVAESRLLPKPAALSFEQAAAVPTAGSTALQALCDRGGIEAGQKVLIDGASGGVGTFAVQIAKAFGADVTAVCSTRNVEIARSLGADRVVDYTREDFSRGRQRYDLILGANAHRSIWVYRRALAPRGTYVMTGGSGAAILQAVLLGALITKTGSRRMGNMMATARKRDLVALAELIVAGKVEPFVDRTYPLRDVPEALRYMENEHARGKIAITM
ncbi:MAG: NAD(P)-dependent alcohol dehydrogenase [Gammaproteobacteria bacterium]|nr:NAD(P)-dependent alcohol dehydrogenase [Gammaproteobacteria bacterium]